MKKLLIVVDYQKDFVDGPIAERIAAYRAAGNDVVFTYDTHGGDYLRTQEGRKLPTPHCLEGSEGRLLFGSTAAARRPLDRCILKSTFPSLELANWLKGKDYDEVELCGVVSYQCVLSNAVMVKSALPEAEVTVDAAAVAGPDRALHEKSLDLMEALQINVINRK